MRLGPEYFVGRELYLDEIKLLIENKQNCSESFRAFLHEVAGIYDDYLDLLRQYNDAWNETERKRLKKQLVRVKNHFCEQVDKVESLADVE